MSTLLFLSGTNTNNNKKLDQFIPTYTNHTFNSPPRGRKRKRQASKGSPWQQRQHKRSPLVNDIHLISVPPSPTSSFSSFTSSSSSSPSLSPLSFTHGKEAHPSSPCANDMDDKKWKQLMHLENEMDFTQDTWATLNVMFESVRLAYLNCAPRLASHPTRLDAMEKELLSAYDDLELQVMHLDKHIQKLESSWSRYKTNKSGYTLTPPSPPL